MSIIVLVYIKGWIVQDIAFTVLLNKHDSISQKKVQS